MRRFPQLLSGTLASTRIDFLEILVTGYLNRERTILNDRETRPEQPVEEFLAEEAEFNADSATDESLSSIERITKSTRSVAESRKMQQDNRAADIEGSKQLIAGMEHLLRLIEGEDLLGIIVFLEEAFSAATDLNLSFENGFLERMDPGFNTRTKTIRGADLTFIALLVEVFKADLTRRQS